MEITRGKIRKGIKFLVYGPEGIGKSTFVSRIPGVVFIDTEGSTGELDVARLPTPTSWQMLLDEVDYVLAHPEIRALVVDTADWAERMCVEHVLATRQLKSIEDAGYGRGYVFLYEEFGKLLNTMETLSQRGVHAGFTAHAMMRKFEQPDELGAYDRWELKMSKKVAPLVKEWSSLMLFANYETMVYATDKEGRKHKAAGGQRIMHATHHPCWDAKNRYGLPDKMPFDFDQVAALFTSVPSPAMATASVPVSSWAGNPAPAPAPAVGNPAPAPAQATGSPASPPVPAAGNPASNAASPVHASPESADRKTNPAPASNAQSGPAAASPAQTPMPLTSTGPAAPTQTATAQTPSTSTATASPTTIAPAAPAQASAASPAPSATTRDPDLAAIPKALRDLMDESSVTPFELKSVIAERGYFPMDTPFANYPRDFVQGVLIGAWPQVRDMILHNRENTPF